MAAGRKSSNKIAPSNEVAQVAKAIEEWPVGRLKAYERNARTHSDDQVAKIARSIERFGFTSPILAGEDGTIIAGHGRLMAAKLLGIEVVPVIVASGWSDDERRAYVLADNQLALEAGWDEELLRLELGDLRSAEFDLSLTGFDADAIAGILDVRLEGHSDPDDVPEPPKVPVSVRGDVWVLGRHRIICGDSTNADDVAAVLDGAKPQLMVTDPPYGVEYDPEWRHRLGVNKSAKRGKIRNDERADWTDAWKLFPGSVAYIWHGALHSTTVATSLQDSGFTIRAQIIWAKERLVMGRGDYHWQHEPCWYAVREKGNWTGDRKQTTLWSIPSGGQDAETPHATQKPIECMRRPIENNSKPGDAIYEPFSGSGTTIIAAEMAGRACYAIELDPAYVDVAVRRWSAFTNEPAMHASTWQTFEQVQRQRAKAA